MELKEYVEKVEWLCIDFDKEYGHQCVDLIKHYSQNVLWIKLWSFWGSAKTWWENKSNTFKPEIFKKNEYYGDNIPEAGDIIFFRTTTSYWHTAIVLSASMDWIRVLEQNVGNWDWKWQDDRIKIWLYNYNNVMGWYSSIKKTEKDKEFLEKIEKAKALWIFNWKDLDKPATRAEVALMCLKVFELISENKKD